MLLAREIARKACRRVSDPGENELRDSARILEPTSVLNLPEHSLPVAALLAVVLVVVFLWKSGKLRAVASFNLKHGKTRLTLDFQPASPKAPSPQAATTIPLNSVEVEALLQTIRPQIARHPVTLLPVAAEPTREQAKLKEAREFLEIRRIFDAKRLFDAVLQVNPQSVEASYGIARISLAQRDWRHALRTLGEAIRVNPDHPFAAEAETRIREIHGWREILRVRRKLSTGQPVPDAFFLAELPEPEVLAQCLAALANRHGGSVFIGFDASGIVTSRALGDGARRVAQAARLRFCEPPCSMEMVTCELEPAVILLRVEEGATKPYACRVGDGSKVFVFDKGKAREADERELRRLKRLSSE